MFVVNGNGYPWKVHPPLSVDTGNQDDVAQLLVLKVRLHLLKGMLSVLQAGEELVLSAGGGAQTGEAGIAI